MINGRVINQVEQYLTIEVDNSYAWTQGEEMELRSTKNQFAAKLRRLFFLFLGWVVKTGAVYDLAPDDAHLFRQGQPPAAQREMLYYLVRWRTEYVKTGYDRQGYPTIEPGSLDDNTITDEIMNKVFNDVMTYISKSIDVTDFINEYDAKLKELGRGL